MAYSAKWLVLMSVVASTGGCSKTQSEPVADKAGAASPGSAISPAPSSTSPAPSATHAEPGVAVAVAGSFDTTKLQPVPASFESGTKVNVENAVGVGCESKVVGDWLELLCYNKNGTGGRPVRAVMPALGTPGEVTIDVPRPDGGAPMAMREFLPEESGMMHVVVPWKAGYSATGMIEWTDTHFVLRVNGQEAKLGWDVTVAMRKTCATFERDQKAFVDRAVKKDVPAAPTAKDVEKLPHFGRCQPAGFGSWAVGVSDLTVVGEGAKRNLKAALEIAFIDFEGKTTRTPAGPIEFAPQKLSIPRLVAFDYDGDGKDEVIVTYELEGTAAPEQKLPPMIWSFDGTKVAAYEKAPELAAGGLSIEQLDKDMRPDLGTYGPFVAWMSSSCGAPKCPDRLTGPLLFAHSDKGGGFSSNDDATRAAGQRMCSSKPATIVAPGAPVNLQRTAHNVACARLWRIETGTIVNELTASREKLCGSASDCEVLTTLTAWASKEPPFTL